MHRTALAGVVLLLASCSTAPTPEPTPEPTQTLDERIAELIDRWGGSEGQYRIILTLDECENLGRLGLAAQDTLDRLDQEGPANPEWRANNGYLEAVLERVNELDCSETIPVP